MILVTGDTHGEMRRVSNKTLRSRGYDPDDISHIIVAGDFGLIWATGESAEERWWTNWLSERPFEVLSVLGNHENFERVYNLPREQRYGSEVARVADGVYILLHGNKYVIDGKSFYVFGGAASIDKEQRRDRITWWQEEIPSYPQFYHGIETCEANDYTFDYVITHTAPKAAIDHVKYNEWKISRHDDEYFTIKGADPTVTMLDRMAERMQCRRWYFGHFHDNIDFTADGIDYSLLYEQFRRIE